MLGSGANYDYSSPDWFLMPRLQHEILTKWKNGHFYDDFDDQPEKPITRLEDIPLEHQGEALTRDGRPRPSSARGPPG